jgi:hypothetical protein
LAAISPSRFDDPVMKNPRHHRPPQSAVAPGSARLCDHRAIARIHAPGAGCLTGCQDRRVHQKHSAVIRAIPKHLETRPVRS